MLVYFLDYTETGHGHVVKQASIVSRMNNNITNNLYRRTKVHK